MKLPIIVLTGPTASGKTRMSFDLAKEFNGEVLAVDSMTVYKGMDIGTDKPTMVKDKESLSDGTFKIKGVVHYLINIVDPDQEMNIAILKKEAEEAVKKVWEKEKIPFLVGGSALYLDSIVYGYQMPEAKPNLKLREELEKQDVTELFQRLTELDPDCEWTIDRNNKRRVIRALEVVMGTGRPFCGQQKKTTLPDNVLYLALEVDRAKLYQKINTRVDQMMKEGFLDEVKELYAKYGNNKAMQAAGYKQLVDFLKGKTSLSEAVEKTKQIHRNFAKKQITWMKKNQDLIWIKNLAEAEHEIRDFLAKKSYTR